MENTGSFGAAIGGSSALKEAMARRGIDISALQQMSPAGAGSSPVPQGVPTTNPSVGIIPGGQPQPQEPQSDNTIAMTALAEVVKTNAKMQRDMVKMQMPQTQQL